MENQLVASENPNQLVVDVMSRILYNGQVKQWNKFELAAYYHYIITKMSEGIDVETAIRDVEFDLCMQILPE